MNRLSLLLCREPPCPRWKYFTTSVRSFPELQTISCFSQQSILASSFIRNPGKIPGRKGSWHKSLEGCRHPGYPPRVVVPTLLGTRSSFMEDNFPCTKVGVGGPFQDDSSALHLLCILYLLILHQLHLRSSSIRAQRLGAPV